MPARVVILMNEQHLLRTNWHSASVNGLYFRSGDERVWEFAHLNLPLSFDGGWKLSQRRMHCLGVLRFCDSPLCVLQSQLVGTVPETGGANPAGGAAPLSHRLALGGERPLLPMWG